MKSFDIIKLVTYPALKIHPEERNNAPIHIVIALFTDISLFLKNEKKIKNGIRAPTINIKINDNNGILNININTIIGIRTIPE